MSTRRPKFLVNDGILYINVDGPWLPVFMLTAEQRLRLDTLLKEFDPK